MLCFLINGKNDYAENLTKYIIFELPAEEAIEIVESIKW